MIVFAGPSIAHADILSGLAGADIRPPARTGDIYKACQDVPKAIGLIDGFFEGVPSVWHKEILWALEQDIAVFGASSMGALRAAELHAFGMTGVGWIFEAFKDGRLEDDDEVALRHGPREMNYVALSEPMVNIRVTLDHAAATGVLDPSIAADLTTLAKGIYFPDRSWDALFTRARQEGLKSDALEHLRGWLPDGRIDQKRLDALDMLAQMTAFDASRPKPQPVQFDFQHTVMWEHLKRECDRAGPGLPMALMLDALRHDPDRYHDLRHRACEQILAQVEGEVSRASLDRAMTQFRSDNQLYTGAALDGWLSDHGVDLAELQNRLAQDIILNDVIANDPTTFQDALLATLREDGEFDTLMAQAKTQADTVRRAGFDRPTPSALGLTPVMLLIWYFEEFRGETVPHDMDVFLHTQGFADREDFEQMMARQYVLWQDKG